MYFRDGISASAGLDNALALSDDRWDDVDVLFVGVTVALLEAADVWVMLPLVRGLWSARGDEGVL